MNLNQIVSGAISAINPQITSTIQSSTGYTTNADGTRIPTYTTSSALMQVQALSYNDIQQIDGLNIQGTKRKIYLNGNWNGLVRADKKGGDKIIMPNGDIYLVCLVLETWPDWCSLAVVLQDNS